MKQERHEETLNEVLDEIETALKDARGLLTHQRRLAFSLSLGAVNLLELHFHKLGIIKEGSKINHTWFKKGKNNVLELLQNQITSPLNSLPDVEQIVELVIQIEEKRDDLAYGAPATEQILQEKINLFFELKKVVQC
ncbi:hypothetical protein HYY73_03485 [Candidatus Woesearchaeota archaeon]|nr:hypothetical protein [Candidatus Woesearchaeota archaeon]